MKLHLVKVKCTVLTKNRDGEDVGKSKNTAIAIRRAETFGNAEIETTKYFGLKGAPENNFSITGIGILNIQDILINFELDQDYDDGKWFKIKVALLDDGQTVVTNLYLVFDESMTAAQTRVKNLLQNVTYDVVFKTSSEISLMEYIELPEEESKDSDSEFDSGDEDDDPSQDYEGPGPNEGPGPMFEEDDDDGDFNM